MDLSSRFLPRPLLLPLCLLAAGLAGALAGGLAAAGCGILDWADDCGHDRGAPGCTGPLATSTGVGAGGTGGTGGTSSSSNTGGGGMGCSDPKSCPPVPWGPCYQLGTVTCTNHVCGVTYAAGPAPSQVYGNCHRNMCDDKGVMTSIVYDNNVFESGNPCEPYVCDTGMSNLQPAAPGMACPLAGTTMGYCEPSPDPAYFGILFCAQCESTATCSPPFQCAGGKCVPPSCTNMVIDPGETDVDCGGALCLPCDQGSMCKSPSDCFSHVCSTTCQVPTCGDHVQNGDETGVDCGGKTCPACQDTNGCARAKDCVSRVCKPLAPGSPDTCQTPTCTDGVQNGNETGVDCGGLPDSGTACLPCGP